MKNSFVDVVVVVLKKFEQTKQNPHVLKINYVYDPNMHVSIYNDEK